MGMRRPPILHMSYSWGSRTSRINTSSPASRRRFSSSESTSGTDTPASVDPEPEYEWTEEFATDEVADESLVLARDAGEQDPEVDQRIDELRKEALRDDDEEDDETRLEGDGA